jgi:hypothetical protein
MKSLTAALLLTLLGCGLVDPSVSCTAMACPNAGGLAVTLTTPPSEPYRVDVTSGTTLRSQNCPSGGSCFPFFNSFMPTTATISVVASSGTATYAVQPRYTTSFPNGPDCGSCTGGVATVSGVIGAVSVYKAAGSVQCSGGGLTPAQMQIELTSAGIGVISAACGVDGNAHVAACGAADGRINIFEVQSADVAAAQGLGFALLSTLPNALRTC